VPYRFDGGQDPVGLVKVLCPSKMAKFAKLKIGVYIIQCFFDPWIRIRVGNKSGSRINILDHDSESLLIT
jgi:hypothetical protein